MRAMISCLTPLSNRDIIEVLSEISWLPYNCVDTKYSPNIERNIDEHREEIFKNIPDEEITTLRATTFVTIYDGATKTWGIVTRTNKYRIKFRLKNPSSTRLKKACESLVNLLRSNIPYKTLKLEDPRNLPLKIKIFNICEEIKLFTFDSINIAKSAFNSIKNFSAKNANVENTETVNAADNAKDNINESDSNVSKKNEQNGIVSDNKNADNAKDNINECNSNVSKKNEQNEIVSDNKNDDNNKRKVLNGDLDIYGCINDNIAECYRKKWCLIYNKGILFEFSSSIQVLEKDSDHDSFTGKILHESLFKATVMDRFNQAILVLFTFLLTVALFTVTSPSGEFYFSGKWWLLPGNWGSWVKGILDRVSTATLVTFLVGSLELYLHWSFLSKSSPIKWSAE